VTCVITVDSLVLVVLLVVVLVAVLVLMLVGVLMLVLVSVLVLVHQNPGNNKANSYQVHQDEFKHRFV
jgi:ABC-type bacteriocin/lantibiotic exporter with double-glycine peptidase domain